MSYRDDQPHEIPWRSVDHQEGDGETWPEGADYIAGTGTARLEEWYGTDTDWRRERKDILRRERARRKLGGFGFRQ